MPLDVREPRLQLEALALFIAVNEVGQRFDKRRRIVSHDVHINRAAGAVGAFTLATMVVGDAGMAIVEDSDLRRERLGVPQKSVAKDDRWSGAPGIFAITRGAIYLNRCHRSTCSPSARRFL